MLNKENSYLLSKIELIEALKVVDDVYPELIDVYPELIDIYPEQINKYVTSFQSKNNTKQIETHIIIDSLIEKQRCKLLKMTPEQLNKLSNKTSPVGRGTSKNKKYKYTLSFYNFCTKQYELVQLVTCFEDVVNVLKLHDIVITKHAVTTIHKDPTNNFIKITKLPC
jgi:hypothetical protein